MAAGTNKTEDAQVQIARLREQVETLMKDRITPAVADFAGRAQGAVIRRRPSPDGCRIGRSSRS